MHKRLATAFLLFFAFSACGGASDPQELLDQGGQALNSGDYQKAADLYASALDGFGSEVGPDWKRAKMGWISAQTRLDAKKAKDEFLALAAAHPSLVDDRDFNQVGSRLGEAGKLEDAVAVLTVGMTAHPESPHLQTLLTELGKKAEASGSSGALDSLKGLGYVGD